MDILLLLPDYYYCYCDDDVDAFVDDDYHRVYLDLDWLNLFQLHLHHLRLDIMYSCFNFFRFYFNFDCKKEKIFVSI